MKEFPKWKDVFAQEALCKIYLHFIEEDVGNMSFGNSEKYIPFFQELREYEECAFHIMLRD